MSDPSDAELLGQFARSQSEAAFAELVERHIGLVYSTALRKTNHPEHARDITQAVFIILARKAGSLGPKTVLPGWLYHTTRLTAANLQRAELRRARREQEAYMQSTINESAPDVLWRELSPLLEDAMAGLGAGDRDALVLRFFQNRSLAEVGAALGTSEDAAKMRVKRALEKLRRFFSKRGVDSTAESIAETISTHSVQPVSAALAKAVIAAAVAKGATASVSTLTLIKGALKVMAWTKTQTTIVVAAVILLAAGTATIAIKEIKAPAAPMPPEPVLPNSNGYNDLVKAGKMILPQDFDATKMDQWQLDQFISKNSSALEMARAAISNDCAVPVQYSTNYSDTHFDELADLKTLARLFLAEGRLAEMEKRPADAAHSYIDDVRLADDSESGGVYIDAMMGVAIENIGTSQLRQLADQLDANTCRQAAMELAGLDAQRPTLENIQKAEKTWQQAMLHLEGRTAITPMEADELKKVDAAMKLKYDAQARRTHQLMIELAARAYELDKGKPITKATDLVPDYLKAIPRDR